MAKIIPFRLPEKTASGYAGHGTPVKRENPPPKPPKEPIIISVMPGESFPAGHKDFRPLLQRDGLILLSRALWEDWRGDGSLLQRYIVTWVASGGKKHQHYATCAIPGKELEQANPDRRADARFYRGLYGSMWDIDRHPDKCTADYLYLAVPFDLDGKTIPAYIQVLKAHGSAVDFDYEFTLGKTLKSNAQAYLEKLASTDQADSL
jgi:hypothetical protein